MIKHLIRSVKDLISGKRHYSLQLMPTDLDYQSVVGEQYTEAKLIDHASGTTDILRIKLTDHNRFVLRWINATRQMKNIGEYCTEHHISPYTLLSDIFSSKSYNSKWFFPELYDNFNKWFIGLNGCKRGIYVDYIEEEQYVVVQACNPYGNRYMVAIDITELPPAALDTAATLSASLMHSEKVGRIMINNDSGYCSLEAIVLKLKQFIVSGAKVVESREFGIVTLILDNESLTIAKRYTP